MNLVLHVLVPDGIELEVSVIAVQAADASGSFGLLPGHEAFVTVLAPGVLSYRTPEGRDRFVAVDGGMLLVEDEHVWVTTHDAVAADQLEDLTDTTAAMLTRRSAEERVARAAFSELETSLRRELSHMARRS
jgi:F-type H+-transporting ATPase subunit epsilon